jgi:hypothetical protein
VGFWYVDFGEVFGALILAKAGSRELFNKNEALPSKVRE